METVREFWAGLTATQRTIIIVGVIALIVGVWASFAFMGTDYSGFGDWLRSWGQ